MQIYTISNKNRNEIVNLVSKVLKNGTKTVIKVLKGLIFGEKF